jgi:hypothetical protein
MRHNATRQPGAAPPLCSAASESAHHDAIGPTSTPQSPWLVGQYLTLSAYFSLFGSQGYKPRHVIGCCRCAIDGAPGGKAWVAVEEQGRRQRPAAKRAVFVWCIDLSGVSLPPEAASEGTVILCGDHHDTTTILLLPSQQWP